MIKSYKTSIVPTKIGSVVGKGSGGGVSGRMVCMSRLVQGGGGG